MIEAARPGLLNGGRPERRDTRSTSSLDIKLSGLFIRHAQTGSTFKHFTRILKEIEQRQIAIAGLTESEKLILTDRLRARLARQGVQHDSAVEAFALIYLAVQQQLHISPHPEQLYAAWCMLHGKLVEMQTGEGKTLTAAFPAIVMAMTGTPVHVITVNDYLVTRDAATLKPVYNHFMLSCCCVTEDMTATGKLQAYAADVVYCSNKQIVFDYLRDIQSLGTTRAGLVSEIRSLLTLSPDKPLLRGLGFAIVDEADSVLIDDARVPLILAESRSTDRSSITEASVALSIATTLHEGADFSVQTGGQAVWLTSTGLNAVRDLTEKLTGAWRFERYRNELIRQALIALHVYRLDRDYLVRDGVVELIDESTGRLLADRKLQHGLHLMLELKEKCAVSDINEVVAALSFQRFFQRYCGLAGMSGTLKEVRGELAEVYALGVAGIPTHKPQARSAAPAQVFPERSQQLEYALQEIQRRHKQGQPLLIGTRSVELSERLGDMLRQKNIEHSLLNARQDANEAEIVARAGRAGAVTVATNMAGRGTDIRVQQAALAQGGLHVVNLEINDSARVDRQLFGRAARQGDVGSCQSILCIKDELISATTPAWMQALCSRILCAWPQPGRVLSLALVRYAQYRREREYARQRLAVFHNQQQLDRRLAVSGDLE